MENEEEWTYAELDDFAGHFLKQYYLCSHNWFYNSDSDIGKRNTGLIRLAMSYNSKHIRSIPYMLEKVKRFLGKMLEVVCDLVSLSRKGPPCLAERLYMLPGNMNRLAVLLDIVNVANVIEGGRAIGKLCSSRKVTTIVKDVVKLTTRSIAEVGLGAARHSSMAKYVRSRNAVRAVAKELGVSVEVVHRVWKKVYLNSVMRLRTGSTLSLFEWQVANVALLYESSLRVVFQKDRILCEMEDMVLLLVLIRKALWRVPRPAKTKDLVFGIPSPSDSEMNETAPRTLYRDWLVSVWTAVHFAYCRSNRLASDVMLQRRWHEARQVAHAVFAGGHTAQRGARLRLARIMADKFPKGALEACTPWLILVQQGFIIDLSDKSPHPILINILDDPENNDAPGVSNAADATTECHNFSNINCNETESINFSNIDEGNNEQFDPLLIKTDNISTLIDCTDSETSRENEHILEKLHTMDPSNAQVSIIFDSDSENENIPEKPGNLQQPVESIRVDEKQNDSIKTDFQTIHKIPKIECLISDTTSDNEFPNALQQSVVKSESMRVNENQNDSIKTDFQTMHNIPKIECPISDTTTSVNEFSSALHQLAEPIRVDEKQNDSLKTDFQTMHKIPKIECPISDTTISVNEFPNALQQSVESIRVDEQQSDSIKTDYQTISKLPEIEYLKSETTNQENVLKSSIILNNLKSENFSVIKTNNISNFKNIICLDSEYDAGVDSDDENNLVIDEKVDPQNNQTETSQTEDSEGDKLYVIPLDSIFNQEWLNKNYNKSHRSKTKDESSEEGIKTTVKEFLQKIGPKITGPTYDLNNLNKILELKYINLIGHATNPHASVQKEDIDMVIEEKQTKMTCDSYPREASVSCNQSDDSIMDVDYCNDNENHCSDEINDGAGLLDGLTMDAKVVLCRCEDIPVWRKFARNGSIKLNRFSRKRLLNYNKPKRITPIDIKEHGIVSEISNAPKDVPGTIEKFPASSIISCSPTDIPETKETHENISEMPNEPSDIPEIMKKHSMLFDMLNKPVNIPEHMRNGGILSKMLHKPIITEMKKKNNIQFQISNKTMKKHVTSPKMTILGEHGILPETENILKHIPETEQIHGISSVTSDIHKDIPETEENQCILSETSNLPINVPGMREHDDISETSNKPMNDTDAMREHGILSETSHKPINIEEIMKKHGILSEMSPEFWKNDTNVVAVQLCKPVAVNVRRLVLRLTKRVELPNIDEVRKINKTMLTAQVAPTVAQVPANDTPLLKESESKYKRVRLNTGESNQDDWHVTTDSEDESYWESLMDEGRNDKSKKRQTKAGPDLDPNRYCFNDIYNDVLRLMADSAKKYIPQRKPVSGKRRKTKRDKHQPAVVQPASDEFQEWERQKSNVLRFFQLPNLQKPPAKKAVKESAKKHKLHVAMPTTKDRQQNVMALDTPRPPINEQPTIVIDATKEIHAKNPGQTVPVITSVRSLHNAQSKKEFKIQNIIETVVNQRTPNDALNVGGTKLDNRSDLSENTIGSNSKNDTAGNGRSTDDVIEVESGDDDMALPVIKNVKSLVKAPMTQRKRRSKLIKLINNHFEEIHITEAKTASKSVHCTKGRRSALNVKTIGSIAQAKNKSDTVADVAINVDNGNQLNKEANDKDNQLNKEVNDKANPLNKKVNVKIKIKNPYDDNKPSKLHQVLLQPSVGKSSRCIALPDRKITIDDYLAVTSETTAPVLRIDDSRPLWVLNDQYIILTIVKLPYPTPSYWTSIEGRGFDRITKLCLGPALIKENLRKKETSTSNFVDMGDTDNAFDPKGTKEQVVDLTSDNEEEESGKVGNIKVRDFAKCEDIRRRYLYKKLRDDPPLYAMVYSVLQDMKDFRQLAHRKEMLYTLSLRTGVLGQLMKSESRNGVLVPPKNAIIYKTPNAPISPSKETNLKNSVPPSFSDVFHDHSDPSIHCPVDPLEINPDVPSASGNLMPNNSTTDSFGLTPTSGFDIDSTTFSIRNTSLLSGSPEQQKAQTNRKRVMTIRYIPHTGFNITTEKKDNRVEGSANVATNDANLSQSNSQSSREGPSSSTHNQLPDYNVNRQNEGSMDFAANDQNISQPSIEGQSRSTHNELADISAHSQDNCSMYFAENEIHNQLLDCSINSQDEGSTDFAANNQNLPKNISQSSGEGLIRSGYNELPDFSADSQDDCSIDFAANFQNLPQNISLSSLGGLSLSTQNQLPACNAVRKEEGSMDFAEYDPKLPQNNSQSSGQGLNSSTQNQLSDYNGNRQDESSMDFAANDQNLPQNNSRSSGEGLSSSTQNLLPDCILKDEGTIDFAANSRNLPQNIPKLLSIQPQSIGEKPNLEGTYEDSKAPSWLRRFSTQ